MHYLRFKPIYKERVWGGQKLASYLRKNIPNNAPIGESWEIVDREDNQSIVENEGRWKGRALESLRRELLGSAWPEDKPFPILVKWLDCSDKLSLQVHPPEEVAESLGGEPKTENWYIADAEPDAKLLLGLKKGVTREMFAQALDNQSLEGLVHEVDSQAGDSVFIPSGRIHAIGGGNLILEVQQNSDTTYRVYDWGRPRELHVEESLKSIDFEDFEPEKVKGCELLAECKDFRIRRFEGGQMALGDGPYIVSVIEGDLLISGVKEGKGSNVIIPINSSCDLDLGEKGVILVTDRFI